MDLTVDIYEPRDFSKPGPAGCNLCGGIIFESLVQLLAMEGIPAPRQGRRSACDLQHLPESSFREPVRPAFSKVEAVYRALFP